jgi:hypothetical protein
MAGRRTSAADPGDLSELKTGAGVWNRWPVCEVYQRPETVSGGHDCKQFARNVHDGRELWQNSPPESGTTKASGALHPRNDRAPL